MQINANIFKKVSDFLVEISNGKWVLFSPAALISAVIHFIVSISNFLFSFYQCISFLFHQVYFFSLLLIGPLLPYSVYQISGVRLLLHYQLDFGLIINFPRLILQIKAQVVVYQLQTASLQQINSYGFLHNQINHCLFS